MILERDPGGGPVVRVTDSHRQPRVGVLGRLGVYPAQRLSGAGRRALAYLSRTLWQLPPDWVVASNWELRLTAEVDLDDAYEVTALAMTSTPLVPRQVELLRHDLLPGWYEEWLVPEQDRFHLRRLQALEQVCRTATEAHDYGLATSAGLAAVCAEPLRESAVSPLVAAHLSEGNRYEAVRRYTSTPVYYGTSSTSSLVPS